MILGFDSVAGLALDKAEPIHLRTMADIHAATFPRAWTDGEIEQLINHPSTLALVLRKPHAKGGAPVAFVMARAAADEIEVLTIAVAPNWQSYGCGRRLMDAVLEHAHRERAASVFLEVDEHNTAARALYRRLGFAEVGSRPGYYTQSDGGRSRALIMRRDIG